MKPTNEQIDAAIKRLSNTLDSIELNGKFSWSDYQTILAALEAYKTDEESNITALQDFACQVSDLMWGGELGWNRPNGLKNLYETIKQQTRACKTVDVERLKVKCLREYDLGLDPLLNQFLEDVVCRTIDYIVDEGILRDE